MDWSNRLGKRIKLRDLHILQAAAEAGSMAKAAADLAMSQPAVSYAVAEMEHALGVPLLERSSPTLGSASEPISLMPCRSSLNTTRLRSSSASP